jgi:alcohol dehydrogenase
MIPIYVCFSPVVRSGTPRKEAALLFSILFVVIKTGLNSLAIGGVAVWIGAVYPDNPVPVDAQMLVRKVLQIRGLHNYNYEDFLSDTLFIENNYQKYPFEDLVEKEYPLDKIEEAFGFAVEKKPVRVGIKIND